MNREDRGVIKRIYLENFVTYDKVTIKPGRNLNLLIGPNGTGKSTVVCAIVLGLCGKPKLVGRGSTVGDYVKTGYEEAKIEIELQDVDNKKITIVKMKLSSYSVVNTTNSFIRDCYPATETIGFLFIKRQPCVELFSQFSFRFEVFESFSPNIHEIIKTLLNDNAYIMNREDRGVIKRIYLENFVTYDKVTIKPGRNLNLLIGPNGTGKSTVVCAIVLGLCGKPKLVGRGSTVGDYVKTGYEEAKIEIELQDVDNKKITIVRKFNKQNQSTWMLNGKNAHGRDIADIVKDLNIQVDNLCQFLPQDKVQSFSEMNSQDLLENTERSVGDPKLVEYHNNLKDFRKQQREIETSMANKERLLESETQKLEGMKEIVSNIKAKKAVEKKINTLKQKKAWMLYDISRQRMSESKVSRDKAAAEMKALDEQLKPIDEKIRRLESRIKTIKKDVEIHNTKLSGKMSIAKASIEDIRNTDHDIRRIEKNRDHKIQAEENRDQEINVIVQQKDKFDNDRRGVIATVGTEEELNAEYHRIGRELEQKRLIVDKLMTQINASRAQEDMINQQIRACTGEMQNAKDVEAKRLTLLRRFSEDAYKGVLWLRQNSDKFTSTIHEPMLLKLHVKDARYSKYFENIIGIRDLIAFVCEDKSDMNRLMGYLRDEQKLTINVIHSDPHKNVQWTPNIPIDNIRPLGFQHYLIDLIDGPETLMKYLISMYQITNIPLGTSAVENNTEQVPTNLRRFFSQNNSYAVSFSKYTQARSTRVAEVSGNGSLSIILDTEKLRGLDTTLDNLNTKKKRIADEMKDVDVEMRKVNAELDELRAAKQQAQRDANSIQLLNSKISIAEKKIQDLQNDRTSIEDIKAAATRDIQKALREQLKMYTKYNSQLNECFTFITENAERKFELESKQRIYVKQTNESQELRDRSQHAEQTFQRLDKELEPLRHTTKQLYQAAKTLTSNLEPQDPDFKKYQIAFAKVPPTIEDIEIELENAEARMYIMTENADAEALLQRYENLKANVEKLQEEIERMHIGQTTVELSINELRPLWLTPLRELIDRINKNFSTYFGLMNCSGEVTLKEGDSDNDFDQYGLKIRVKFRDADELQELTRQHQSGGERAVTTAVYMIALQELSRVPFRCVDEINQGMDAVNERRVFELIVQITEKDHSSQYFFVTPKLLPDLEYGNNVTLLCVFNGAYMLPSEQSDVNAHIAKRKRTLRI